MTDRRPSCDDSQTAARDALVEPLAHQLERCWLERTTREPFSVAGEIGDVTSAYAVQQAWTQIRQTAGDHVVGRKIGLTSRAVQEQMGVREPDFGSLWASRQFAPARLVEVQLDAFIQPRVEGEVAFLLGGLPERQHYSAADVRTGTEAVAAAIEIVDSRITDWQIGLVDTVADNASFGGFVHGPWRRLMPDDDLVGVPMTLEEDGVLVGQGAGRDALGDPASAVAWLLNKLLEFGQQPRAGDIVLSGALSAMRPAVRGRIVEMRLGAHAPLRMTFD